MINVSKISSKYKVKIKVVDLRDYSRKDIGNLGESVAAEYLRRRGFVILGRNIARKWGELDIAAQKGGCLHIVEVKTRLCPEFSNSVDLDLYHPGQNLNAEKIRKVMRMASWYTTHIGWEGETQVDGALVWLREHDGMARVRYLPQIL